jgi:hypothetical protein
MTLGPTVAVRVGVETEAEEISSIGATNGGRANAPHWWVARPYVFNDPVVEMSNHLYISHVLRIYWSSRLVMPLALSPWDSACFSPKFSDFNKQGSMGQGGYFLGHWRRRQEGLALEVALGGVGMEIDIGSIVTLFLRNISQSDLIEAYKFLRNVPFGILDTYTSLLWNKIGTIVVAFGRRPYRLA